MSGIFMFIHILRIESFCINVNILYAHAVDTVAFTKVTTSVGLIYKNANNLWDMQVNIR